MTAVAITLGIVGLYWIAATNFGSEGGGSAEGGAPAEDSGNSPTTDNAPPAADEAITDGSEFSSGK
ncbi:MAG: hypothetical protein VYB18_04600 [Thermodesulfobacteriota bacterium]|jgi:hypothetical protein|nr:hypothetical protein [Thermodesulfobacteriota bacterium]